MKNKDSYDKENMYSKDDSESELFYVVEDTLKNGYEFKLFSILYINI